MWKYYQSNRLSKKYSQCQNDNKQRLLQCENLPKNISNLQLIQIQLRFSDNFTLKMNLPGCLNLSNLIQIIRSYIKLHQKFAGQYHQFIGVQKNILSLQSNSSLDSVLQYVLDCYLISMKNIKLQDFNKKIVQFDIKYRKVDCEDLSKNTQYKNQKWLNNIQVFSQSFLNSNKFGIMNNVNLLQQYFFVTVSYYNQQLINLNKLFYYPKSKMKSFKQIYKLLQIKQIFQIFDCQFNELLVASFRTIEGYFMVLQNNFKIKLTKLIFLRKQLKNQDIYKIFNGIIKIIEYVFNSSKSHTLKLLILNLMQQDKLLDMFCFNLEDLSTVRLDSQFMITNVLQIRINSQKVNKDYKAQVISYLKSKYKQLINKKFKQSEQNFNLFDNKYPLIHISQNIVNLQQSCNRFIYQYLHQQLCLYFQNVLQNSSINELRKKNQQILLIVKKILQNQKVIKCKQFEYQREVSKVYKANFNLDLHEKSTIKKFQKRRSSINQKNKDIINKSQKFNNNKHKITSEFTLDPQQHTFNAIQKKKDKNIKIKK